MAETYINNSNFDKAEAVYNDTIKQYPEKAAPYIWKANFLYKYKKDSSEAKKLFEVAVQKSDASDDAYYWLGIISYDDGDYNKAINYFEKAIELNSNDPISYGAASLSYLKTQQTEKGLDYAQKSLEIGLDKENKKRLIDSMVEAAYDITDIKSAEKIADYILKIDPENSGAYSLKGILALIKLDYTSAEKYYKIAIEKNPESYVPFVGLCSVYYQKDEYINSLYNCDTALQLNSTDITAYYFGALSNSKIGNLDKASDYIDKAIDLDSTDPYVAVAAGQIYALKASYYSSKNDSEKMAQALLKSIDFSKDQTAIETYALLGDYYNKKNNLPSAKKFIDLATNKINELDITKKRAYVETYKVALNIYDNLGDKEEVAQLNNLIEVLQPTNENNDLPLPLNQTTYLAKKGYVNKTIYLVPMDVDEIFITDLSIVLTDKFKMKFVVFNNITTSKDAYDSLRDQYYAEILMGVLYSKYNKTGEIPIFGITSKDITTTNNNYIFGLTNSNVGVISLNRFTYSQANTTKLFRRALVQSISTIGKSLGLSVPTNPKCALSYVNNLEEFDRKEPILCRSNQEELENILKNYSWIDNEPETVNEIYKYYQLERD